MKYTVTLQKSFSLPVIGIGFGDVEFKLYTSSDRQWSIDHARRMNSDPFLNIQVERFRVWESKNGKMNKAATLIYPTQTESLL